MAPSGCTCPPCHLVLSQIQPKQLPGLLQIGKMFEASFQRMWILSCTWWIRPLQKKPPVCGRWTASCKNWANVQKSMPAMFFMEIHLGLASFEIWSWVPTNECSQLWVLTLNRATEILWSSWSRRSCVIQTSTWLHVLALALQVEMPNNSTLGF